MIDEVQSYLPNTQLKADMRITMLDELTHLSSNLPNFKDGEKSHAQFTQFEARFAGYIRGEVIQAFKRHGISKENGYNIKIDASMSPSSFIYIPKKSIPIKRDKA